jgi:putative peptidoglycan lipid II flippase
VKERAKKFLYYVSSKKLTVPSAALILAASYLVSNILGVYRERLIAWKFGASHLTDIFYASFRLPDLIFNLLVLGAVSSAFIPVFVDYVSKEKEDEANKLASNFMNFLLIGSAILLLVIFVLARKLVPFLLPGFFTAGKPTDINTFETTVMATRIMLISPIFFAISSVFGGILNAKKRFLSYSLAPVIYNLSIIVGILFFTGKTNPPIYGLLYGVILGAFLHALIQLPAVLVSGFRWKPILNLRAYELPKIFKLMVPRSLAIGVGQINILVDTIIASYFLGGITVLNFANDIQTLPTVVFGISIATAVFPLLAEQSTREKRADFLKTFSESARKILYFMIPATIGLIVLRAQVVRLIFGLGNFSWENTYWTTKALGFFAIGLLAQGLIPLLVRAFYALKDTKTPLIIGLIVMAVNALFSVTLPFIPGLDLGISGVALAYSIAGFVNVFLLFYYLHGKIGALDKNNKIFASTSRLFLASIIMGVVAHYSLYLFDFWVNTSTVIGLFLQTTGAVAVGALTYYALTHLFGCEETGIIFKKAII